MIDKNFYLENLSAFDILIQDEDRKQAETLIFRVFSILQRDKIWLRDVATEEEIFEEDVELLEEVEEELQELDQKYNFGFEAFYRRVQLELKKIQSKSDLNVDVAENFAEDEDFEDDNLDFMEEENEEDPDLYEEEEEDDFEDDDLYDDEDDALSHISDEELDQITDYILESAKTRFDYSEFLEEFPQVDELFVEENILFPIIGGKAHEETDHEIAAKMNAAFLISGFQMSIDDLQEMIEKKGHELGLEILAFGIAADSLQQGANPAEVLHQISQLLKP